MLKAASATKGETLRGPVRQVRVCIVLALGFVPWGTTSAVAFEVAQATVAAPAAGDASAATPATPTSPPAATETKAPDAAGTPATVMDVEDVESLLGKDVQSASGENMGRIADVLVDKTGHMRAAVIDFGGFLGVGSRKIAVDWQMIHFPATGKSDKIIVDLPRNELRVAPAYKDGEPVVILGRPAEAKPAIAAPASSTVPAAPAAK